MSEPRPEPTKSFFKRTWLRRSLLALAIMLALLLAVILAVPLAVSSDWARGKVEQGLACCPLAGPTACAWKGCWWGAAAWRTRAFTAPWSDCMWSWASCQPCAGTCG